MRHIILSLVIVPSLLATGTLSQCYADRESPAKLADAAQEKCLAVMIYGEARGETEHGQIAVAYTALNRSGKKTVCAVVLAPKQYSVFNNNPALRAAAMSLHVEPQQKNTIDNASWAGAVHVAQRVIRRQVPDPTVGATHYLAPSLMISKGYVYPRWSREYRLVTVIDNHRFYKPPARVDKQVASL